MLPLGQQFTVDLFDCAADVDVNDVALVREALLRAAVAGEATVVSDCFHHFSPHGVSGVVIIAESHIAAHTWPEHRFVAIDIFTCGTSCKPEEIRKSLEADFRPGRVEFTNTPRGVNINKSHVPTLS